MKKILVFGLSLALLLSISLTAMATPSERNYEGINQGDIIVYNFDKSLLFDDWAARLKNISTVAVGFTISNSGAGNVMADCDTYTTCSITVKAELQRFSGGSWTTIKTYTNSTKATYCKTTGSYPLTPGYNYKVKATATANGETVSQDSVVRYY